MVQRSHGPPNRQVACGAMSYLKQSEKDKEAGKLRESTDKAQKPQIEMLAERMTGDIVEKYTSPRLCNAGLRGDPMQRRLMRPLRAGLVTDVGFCHCTQSRVVGASPDGFVGDGLIEIKCPNTSTHLQWIVDGVVPEEHHPQMILQCAVTQRGWCDFVSYDSRLPQPQQLFVRRFFPTNKQIEEIEREAKLFLLEVEGLFQLITQREMVEL
jgi:hypothetical protein